MFKIINSLITVSYLDSFQFDAHIFAVTDDINVLVHLARGAVELKELHHSVVRVQNLVS